MEQGRVGCIHRIGPVYSAGRNDADGGLLVFHHMHLHGGSLGAEQNVVGNVEGVLCIPCRMVRGQIQRLKVVVVILHLRTVCDREAHAQEDFLNLVCHNGQRVQLANGLGLAGQGNVDGFAADLHLLFLCLELCKLVPDGCFNVASDLVCQLPDHGTFLSGQTAHLLEDAGQFPFLAQKANPEIIQSLDGAAVSQSLLGSCFNVFQLLFHAITSPKNKSPARKDKTRL